MFVTHVLCLLQMYNEGHSFINHIELILIVIYLDCYKVMCANCYQCYSSAY